jgi:hypothetical protein
VLIDPRSRENTVLRSNLPPKSVYVIPNAIVADHFRPPSSVPPTDISQYSESTLTVFADLSTYRGAYSNHYRYLTSRLQKGC